jgi:hypothetical protein
LEMTVGSQRELLAVQTIATDIWNCTAGVGLPLYVQVTPEQRAAIDGLGIAYRVKHESVDAAIAAHLAAVQGSRLARDDSWFTSYKNLAEHNAFLDGLVTANPALATGFTYGNSLQNRPLRGVRITGPDEVGNPRSSRRSLLVFGGQHAREWVNHATTVYLAHELLERYPTDAGVRDLLSKVEVIVIPVANPDGYEFSWTTTRLWRKNRRDNGNGTVGVDLNRNWGFAWGSDNGSSGTPSSDAYRGPSAFSEPETVALRDFVIANPRIAAAIDVHNFSQLILSPWGSTPDLPVNAGYFDQVNRNWASAIFGVYARAYRPGPTYTNIYPVSGGSTDWFWGDRNILAWGIELRDRGQSGFLLPPDQILPTAEENFEGFVAVLESVAAPVKLYVPSAVPIWTPTTAPTVVQVAAEPNRLPLDGDSVRVFYRVGTGAFTTAAMSSAGGTLFSATVATPPS